MQQLPSRRHLRSHGDAGVGADTAAESTVPLPVLELGDFNVPGGVSPASAVAELTSVTAAAAAVRAQQKRPRRNAHHCLKLWHHLNPSARIVCPKAAAAAAAIERWFEKDETVECASCREQMQSPSRCCGLRCTICRSGPVCVSSLWVRVAGSVGCGTKEMRCRQGLYRVDHLFGPARCSATGSRSPLVLELPCTSDTGAPFSTARAAFSAKSKDKDPNREG